MTEHIVFEYLVNSLWQLPLLLAATWLVVRISQPGLVMQHALWIAALTLGVLLPLRGVDWNSETGVTSSVALDYPALQTDPIALYRFPALPSTPPVKSLATRLRELAALRVRPVHLESRTIDWLIGMYAVSAALSLARLVHGWIAARSLVAAAAEHPLTTLESTLLRTCAERLKIPLERVPAVRFLSDPEASPMVVGVRHPVLLLPEKMRHTADGDFNDAALTAMFLHELAHVRRRDYLANLTARVISLPIAYHPATQALHRRIRQTREMICDSHAAGVFASKSSYARSLLALAEGIVSPHTHVEAVGLFDHTRNSLEERIMQLTEPGSPNNFKLRMGRVVAGTLVLMAGTGAAATLHVKAATPLICALQTPQSAPAPVVEQEPAPQAPAPAPVPQPTPAVKAMPASHPDLDATVDAQVVQRKLTPEERKQLDEQMAAVKEQMKSLTLQLKDMKPITIPPIDLKDLHLPELQKQMSDLKLQFDTPEFRQQMEKLQQTMKSEEFKKQMNEAMATANNSLANSAEFKQRMDELNRQMNSAEFKQQLEAARLLAMQAETRTSETREQLEDVRKALAEARSQVHDESVQKMLDEAQQRLQEATKSIR